MVQVKASERIGPASSRCFIQFLLIAAGDIKSCAPSLNIESQVNKAFVIAELLC